MAQSLGERVKTLRKELKMTQTDLTGSEMTKSMLSQIENNLATPSMKNLQYLASRLSKPVSYFLEDINYHGSLPLEEIHEDLKAASELINSRKQEDALVKLEAMLSKYNFDRDSKLFADFLSKRGECLIDLNHYEAGEENIKEAVDIYKNKFLFVDASKAHITLIGIPWSEFNYQKCLDILDDALKIYNNSISKDYAFEIETLQIRSVLYMGLDRLEDSIAAAEKALKISKETNIYYRSDELYKNLAGMNAFLGNFENFDLHLEKARQFAVFAENYNILASIDMVCGMYSNQQGKPEKALEYLDKALQIPNSINYFAFVEKAKSFYLMEKYQQALDFIKLVKYPAHTPFKYDYLHMWSAKIYEGLCLGKIGRSKEAIDIVKSGIEKLKVVGNSKTLAFAYKSLSEIYSDIGDFENAFAALKKSNELAEFAKENKLYY